MDLKKILDLKTDFQIDNDSDPTTFYLSNKDIITFEEDLRNENSPIPKDVRSELAVKGIGPLSHNFLERFLMVKVVLDYTDKDGTHFE